MRVISTRKMFLEIYPALERPRDRILSLENVPGPIGFSFAIGPKMFLDPIQGATAASSVTTS